MWVPNKSKLVKICLHSQNKDVETAWAEDLGEAPGQQGAHLVRLGNVPFLHAKPTYGDALIVEYDPVCNRLTWDAGGVPFERIGERIAEDGGRYAMIIDYELKPSIDAEKALRTLDQAGEKANLAVEVMSWPNKKRPGRAHLAVPYAMSVREVLAYLNAQNLPMSLTLVHPL